MGNKRRELQQLFHTWRKFHESCHLDAAKFVSDGFVGEEADYENSETKVLLLLKDPNDSGNILKECDFDLCQLWRFPERVPEYSNRNVERTCGTWADCIQRTGCGEVADYKRSKDNFRQALLRSAVINVKKTAGLQTVDSKLLRAHARRDQEFILREIGILDPNVVVCGGIFEDVANPIFQGFRPIGKSKLCFLRNGAIWIDHQHPRLGSRWSYKVLLANYLDARCGQVAGDCTQT
ncbi:MAG TPA: hypothetical protein VFE47_24525 [Tepidisphaeraceae bacterium]|nr:hypothetical protein [Tepidisphaeraceae bacterium]